MKPRSKKGRKEQTSTLDDSNTKHKKHITSYFDKFKNRLTDGYIEGQLGIWRLFFSKEDVEEGLTEERKKEYEEFEASSSLHGYVNKESELSASDVKSIHDEIMGNTELDEETKLNKSLALATEAAIKQTKDAIASRETTHRKISLTPDTNPEKPSLSPRKTKDENQI